jgi:hypothetical protein
MTEGIVIEDKECCRDCQRRYWCAGSWPLETFRATGRYNVKTPNCNIYQAIFPEVLRMEGLRLLKYQDDPELVQKKYVVKPKPPASQSGRLLITLAGVQ